jgi:hypothetical protein
VLLVEKPEHLEKTTDLPQVTDKLYLIKYSMSRIKTHNFLVVIRTDCIGNCKFQYHLIMAAPDDEIGTTCIIVLIIK